MSSVVLNKYNEVKETIVVGSETNESFVNKETNFITHIFD